MHDSSRALLKRGSIAAATTALVIGSSFAAPAIATTPATPEPASIETLAAPMPDASQDANKAAVPSGLKEAVERDLGITLDTFYKNGELSTVVDSLDKQLKQSKLEADFKIVGNKISITVAKPALKAVTKKLEELTSGTDIAIDIVTAVDVEATVAPEQAEITQAPEAAPSKLPVIESPNAVATAKPKIEAKAMPKNAEALLAAYVESVDPQSVAHLQAVMKTGANSFVIRTGGMALAESKNVTATPEATALRVGAKLTPDEFAQQYTKVTIEQVEGPAKPAAANDVLGGMGYGAEVIPGSIALCSIGFSGFNATGEKAVISAGHCQYDGAISKVNIMEHTAPNVFEKVGEPLGDFGFSQFGGPGNTPVTGFDSAQSVNDLGNVGTDISVIDTINTKLNLKAMVSNWKGADERNSGTKVTGVASAVIGANVCKSGRTTGWTCGTVDEVGIFLVGGYNGADDVRGIRGFGMANAGFSKAFEGDSGGSVISGGTAVGLTSAISPADGGRAYFTDIKDGLKHAKGYEIALFLNAPAVTSPANGAEVRAGTTIIGTVAGAPSGTKVVVRSAGQKNINATVTAGKFSFRAPKGRYGKYAFTLQTVNGHSTSAKTAGSLKVAPVAPSFASPANGQEFAFGKVPKTISGFGINGATVNVSIGDANLTATVADGAWTILVPEGLTSGDHTVTAVQVIDGVSSPAVSIDFTIAAAPKPKPKPTQDPEPSKAPVVPLGNGNIDDGGSGALANTGPNSALPFIATGGALMVAGGLFMLIRRKDSHAA